MDFIVKLPNSDGYDAVLVFVDNNTKLAHFILTNKMVDSKRIANLYLYHTWKRYGLPNKIISDRNFVIVFKFMKRLCKLLHIRPPPTTTFHLQYDGHRERINQILEQFLCMFSMRQQDDWAILLLVVEFAYNNAIHSTSLSPFMQPMATTLPCHL